MQKHLGRLYDAHGEKLRFLVTGVFNTAFGYALFLTMLVVVDRSLRAFAAGGTVVPEVITANYFIIAQWTSWILSVPVGTWTMKTFAFRSKGHLPHEIARAYLVYLPAVALNSGILWVGVHALHLPPAVAQLVSIAISVMFSYFGHKYFTFGVRTEP